MRQPSTPATDSSVRDAAAIESKTNDLHVAIIPDGNRRAAKRLMQQPWKGHEWGTKKLQDVLDWCVELGITKVTFYAFSLKNFVSRPREEIKALMGIFRDGYRRMMHDKKVHDNQVRINFIGRLHIFPQDVQQAMADVMAATKDYSRFVINFAMGYDGRAEILDMVKRVCGKVKAGELSAAEITDKTIKENLYTGDDVDLIIRTSGERRTSSFLPYQADYAELSFIQDFWPDLKKEEFVAAVSDFKNRERRFGK